MIYVYRNYDKEIIFHFSVYMYTLSFSSYKSKTPISSRHVFGLLNISSKLYNIAFHIRNLGKTLFHPATYLFCRTYQIYSIAFHIGNLQILQMGVGSAVQFAGIPCSKIVFSFIGQWFCVYGCWCEDQYFLTALNVC